MSYNQLKVKVGVFSTDYTVAMITHYVKKITITCSQIFRHIFDTIFVITSDKECFYYSVKTSL